MLREELGWDGHVVSDCTAIELMGDAKYDGCAPPYPPVDCKPDPFSGHNFTHGVVETANVAFTAGVDSNCGPFYRMWLGALAANGSVAQADVDLAVTRVYRTAVRLGLLDDPAEGRPYAQLDAEGLEHPLRVVPAQVRFSDGGYSLGEQASQQDRTFNLGARHGRHVVNGVQRTSVNAQGRAPLCTLRRDARTHLVERVDDSPHGPM